MGRRSFFAPSFRKREFKTPTLPKTSVHLCLFVVKPDWIAFPLRGRASTMFAMTYWMKGEKNDKPLNTHSGHECLGKISRPPF